MSVILFPQRSGSWDGVSLYLREPRTSIGDMMTFMAVGRLLERLGIPGEHVTLERMEPMLNMHVKITFARPEEASAFRLATALPFMTTLPPDEPENEE